MMDKEDGRIQLASLMGSRMPYLGGVNGKTYIYSNIPEKYNKVFIEYYDPTINLNEVVAFIDATLMHSGKYHKLSLNCSVDSELERSKIKVLQKQENAKN